MTAPDKIWAFPKEDWFDAGASTHKIKAAGAKDVEYTRTDTLPALLAAEREKALREAAHIMSERAKSCRTTVGADAEGQCEGGAEDILALIAQEGDIP